MGNPELGNNPEQIRAELQHIFATDLDRYGTGKTEYPSSPEEIEAIIDKLSHVKDVFKTFDGEFQKIEVEQ